MPARGRPRVGVVDAVRGIAVLAMIEWHTAEAWLGGASREGTGFVVARMIGGLAAPAFLFLAGMSLGLASKERPTAHETLAGIRRAARIVLVGYALSFFSWVVDHGAILDRRNLAAIVALFVALVLGALAVGDRERSDGVRAGLAVAGIAAAELGVARLVGTTRGGLATVPRLDVLHGIGAALVVTGIALWAVRGSFARRAAVLGAIAVSVATLAVSMIGMPQRVLPHALAAWIARDVEGPAGFPLFPWVAYALLGAAIALAWRAGAMRLDHEYALPSLRRPWALALVGFAIAATVWEPMPFARFVLDAHDELRSLFRLVYNVSVIAGAAGLVAAFAPRALASMLALLGRSSMLVYCAHLELAYGLAGVPLRRTLSFGTWAPLMIGVVIAMLALAHLAERRGRAPRARSAPRGALESTEPHVSSAPS